MKGGTFRFTVVPHKDGAFAHNFEVDPFPYEFNFHSVPGPFLRADEELGWSWEAVDVFENNIVKLTCVILQVQGGGAYTLGIDESPDAVDFRIVPLF